MSLGGPFPLRGEDEWVAALRARWTVGAGFPVGIGHDCATLDLGGGPAVVTTDALVDGVHFELLREGARAAAVKAVGVNLSDLAAAAAEPVAWFLALVLPRGAPPRLRDELADGFEEAVRRYGVPCAGGDTNVADGPLVLAVTAVGRAPAGRPVTRAGAQVGDRLSVTGPLGGSRAGRHLDVRPRLRAGQVLAARGLAHAMLDLSDGLSRDLPRLCAASGVGARIDPDAVPLHPDARAAAADGRSPLEHALDDGEDFELLVAHPPLTPADLEALLAAGVLLTTVGEVVPRAWGIRLLGPPGACGPGLPLVPRGHDHLLTAPPAKGGGERVVRTRSPEGTAALARTLGELGRPAARAGLCVALRGDLGAGKTLFVRSLFRGLGLPEAVPVTSPTFTVAQRYDLPWGPVLHHVDLYRLGGVHELEAAGLEEAGLSGADPGPASAGAQGGRVTCVEWPERAPGALPEDRLEVRLCLPPMHASEAPSPADLVERRVTLRALGPRSAAWLALLPVQPGEEGA